jgi:type II secretory pathway pseudopilin PulG
VAEAARSRGFSLVEPLVALLLVGTALLGVGGLQLAALRGGAQVLELLAAQEHVVARAEGLRALHGVAVEDRLALLGDGAPHGCRGERRCTPREFAEDEAARGRAAGAARGWAESRSVSVDGPTPLRATLRVSRGDRPLVVLGVES